MDMVSVKISLPIVSRHYRLRNQYSRDTNTLISL